MLSFFPLDLLDAIWYIIELVFEGFLTYFYIIQLLATLKRSKDNSKEIWTTEDYLFISKPNRIIEKSLFISRQHKHY